jgi:hypothetical protein
VIHGLRGGWSNVVADGRHWNGVAQGRRHGATTRDGVRARRKKRGVGTLRGGVLYRRGGAVATAPRGPLPSPPASLQPSIRGSG